MRGVGRAGGNHRSLVRVLVVAGSRSRRGKGATPGPLPARPSSGVERSGFRVAGTTPEEGVVVTGEVVRLHREPGGSGEITLVGRVDEQEPLRRIWIDLPGNEYELAMRAHQEMKAVTVAGDLVRRGTRYLLASPAGFRILPAG